MGFNQQGHLVDLNHKCGCGQRLPMPEYEGKFCPKCGTKQSALTSAPRTPIAENVPACFSCGAKNQRGDFCTECGGGLSH